QALSILVWHADLGVVVCRRPRGTFAPTTGRAAAGVPWLLRPHPPGGASSAVRASDLVLAPEEALHLVERGSAVLRRAETDALVETLRQRRAKEEEEATANAGGEEVGSSALKDAAFSLVGAMSLQEAYAALIRPPLCTLEEYQVYAHLKRLGYIVVRPPHRRGPAVSPKDNSGVIVPQRREASFYGLCRLAFDGVRWLLLRLSGFFHTHSCSRGLSWASARQSSRTRTVSSVEIMHHFDVYRPSTRYRKSEARAPDIAVYVARSHDALPPAHALAAWVDRVTSAAAIAAGTVAEGEAAAGSNGAAATAATQAKVAVVRHGQISFLSLGRKMLDPTVKATRGRKKRARARVAPAAAVAGQGAAMAGAA
ncbi:hypothetical protein HK405_000057, partial [Cladochytrium tenue]